VRLPAALLCALAALPAAAQERLEDFAYAVGIELSANGGLYQLEVPRSVYEGATRPDLGDLRVFNGRGEPVPHAFKPRPQAGHVPSAWVGLPFFPLRGEEGGAVESLSLRAERTPSGTIVSVTSADRSKRGIVLLGYLVDGSSMQAALREIDLAWDEPGPGFSGNLHVEGSADLRRWHPLVASAPLVDLEFRGQRLVQRTISLPAARYKYLRLGWPPGQQPLRLTRVRARPGDRLIEPARQWISVRVSRGERDGEYSFQPEGQIPVDRLRLILPEPNTLAAAQVLARNAADQPWQTLTSGVIYRLTHEGREVVRTELEVAGRGWKHWLLRVDPRGGGLGFAVPQLQVGWIPQQLVFIARGDGPFQLAYGKAGAKSAELPIQTLVPGWRSDAELKAASAMAGAQRVLAGARALKPAADYKTWALWASLAAGVLALAWMAWQLARQMRSAAGRTPRAGS
jgi:hypothetical protein